jgi:MFS family permease
MSATFRSFAVRNYRLWWAGATVSNIGTWMQRTAQDWIVLTQLTDNDAAAVGITMALQFGPPLFLTPIAGLVVDRMDRRHLLLITQIAMGTLGLGLGVLTITGVVQLWMVFGFALLLGVATAFDGPARQTFVSELVPDDHLSNAVGLNATSFNVARLIGPAVAGLLTAAVGAGWVFLINAVSFGAVVGMLLALRVRDLVPRERLPRRRGQIVAGFRYVQGRLDLRLVFLMVALLGTFGMNFPIFISTMSVMFGSGAGEFGVLSSAMAVGSVVGALLAARRDKPRLRTVAIASGSFGLAVGAASLAPNPIVFGALLALVGASSVTMLNSSNAYVQTTTAPELRGRVMSLYLAILMGGTMVGAPLIGWVANAAGPRWAMAVGAAAGIIAAAIAAIYWVRLRRVSLTWVPAQRWPLALRFGDAATSRELATTEIAVVETQTQR